jgi:chromosomal replication initiation ATPase DnaA
MDTLVDATCREFSVSPHVLLGRYRANWEAGARHALAASLRATGLSFQRIGELMGRDHGTAMNSYRRAMAFADTEPRYKAKLDSLVTVAINHVTGVHNTNNSPLYPPSSGEY